MKNYSMKDQTFGIEIETSGVSRHDIATIIADYYGTTPYYIGTYYDTWAAETSDGRVWKCMSDSSVITTNCGKMCEIVSPILKYEDMNDLQEIVRLVRAAGAKSSTSLGCGIHVHIGAKDHTVQTLKNVVNFMSGYQDIIYKALAIDSSRESRWCKKLESVLVDKFNDRDTNTNLKQQIAWYGTSNVEAEKSKHYNQSRYHGINLHAVFTKGTVEFRLFNGTLHAGKIRAYICLCLAINNFALNARSVSRKRKQDNWSDCKKMNLMLSYIGLDGEEFKNCRKHLTDPLKSRNED